jgi:predicted PurR-regulated permease PerM
MDFSIKQSRIITTGVTVLALLVILAATSGLVWLVSVFLRSFAQVFLPLAVAGVLALVLRPYFEWLRRRLRLPVPLALVAMLLSALIPLVAFGWFFGAILVEQVEGMIEHFPAWWEQTRESFEQRWPRVVEFFSDTPLGQRLREAAEDQQARLFQGLQVVGGKALSAGAGFLRGIATLLSWAVMPVYLVFFLMGAGISTDRLGDYLPFLKPETRKDVVFLVREFVNILVAFFRGQLLVALAQGVLFAIGFTLVGLQFGFVLGLVLGFLNIIPYLGSMIGLAITLPLAYFQTDGGTATLLWVLGVFVVVQMIEGYVLTPRIMGDRTGLHPMAIIVAVFFWGSALGGILGMILAIPLTAFLVVFWRLAKEKYIEEWV